MNSTSEQLLQELQGEGLTAASLISKVSFLEGRIAEVKESGKTEDQWKIGYYERQIQRLLNCKI